MAYPGSRIKVYAAIFIYVSIKGYNAIPECILILIHEINQDSINNSGLRVIYIRNNIQLGSSIPDRTLGVYRGIGVKITYVCV